MMYQLEFSAEKEKNTLDISRKMRFTANKSHWRKEAVRNHYEILVKLPASCDPEIRRLQEATAASTDDRKRMGRLPGHSRSHLWMLMLQSPCWREDASVLPPNLFQVDPLAKFQPYPCWWESLGNRPCDTLENIKRAGDECSLPLNNI